MPEVISYQERLKETVAMLKALKKEQSISKILMAEKYFLEEELQHADSKEAKSSLQAALVGLKEAVQALTIAQDPEKYQALGTAMSNKDKQSGLPLDGFRRFERLSSHPLSQSA